MRDSILRRYVEALVPLTTLLLACMPLLGMRGMVLAIALWLLALTMRSSLDPTPVQRNALRWTAFLALPVILMIPDMLRAPDLITGWKHVERSVSYLLFPLGFLLLGGPSSDRFREAMMDLFTLAAVVLGLIVNSTILIDGYPPNLDPATGFSNAYRTAFSLISGLHPPYASYFFLSAAVFQSVRLLDRAPRPALRMVLVALLFIASLLLSSRTPLIGFGAAMALVLLMRLSGRRAVRTAILVFLGMAVLAAIIPGARERVAEAVLTARYKLVDVQLNSTNIRVPIAQCTLELLEDNWLLGTGQANAQTALDQCYKQFNEPLLWTGNFGTHNQLLHWWLCFGLAGLVLYIVYFGTLLIHAWQRRDAAHFGFLVLILVCASTENVLARQWGVVLFTCFNTLFMAASDAPDPASPTHPRR